MSNSTELESILLKSVLTEGRGSKRETLREQLGDDT